MIELKTDWRESDYYKAPDLNRVGTAVKYLAELLAQYGCRLDTEAKTDWTVNDIPTVTQMARYLLNVKNLRSAISISAGTPNTPNSMQHLTWQKANDIEQILIDIDKLLTLMAQTWIYSGAPNAYSGTNLYIATRTHLVTEGGDIILQENGEYLTLENAPDLPTWKGA